MKKMLNEICRYKYQNIRFSNMIPNLHYTLMSRDCKIVKNYFSTIKLMRPVSEYFILFNKLIFAIWRQRVQYRYSVFTAYLSADLKFNIKLSTQLGRKSIRTQKAKASKHQ